MSFERDRSFPMEIRFTACLTQEILTRERATQQIEQLDAFHVMVWNPGSKTIVDSMWEEYSRHLPHSNFHPQKAFLQALADQFKTPLPKRMIDRKILEIIREEFYRMHNDCPSENIWQITEHIDKLRRIIRFMETQSGQGRTRGVQGPEASRHYQYRNVVFPEPSSFAQSIIQWTTERVVEMEHRMEREFRTRILGEPPRAEDYDHVADSLLCMAQTSTLTAESIQRAVQALSRSGMDFQKNNRFRMMESIQREHPRWKLGQVNEELKNRGFEPSLDHEQSKVMPGKSKGVAGYIMLNDKLKVMLDRLCDLNTWKPNV